MSEKPTDRVDWALGEARRMVSERPHSPQARSAAVLADEVCRLREERDDYKHLMEFETSRAEELARQRDAAEAEVQRLREQLDGVTRRPTEAGGPGKEEAYWMRQKLQASIGHLRDIEDYFRVEVGGEPGSYNMARADRARSLYEQMSEDFIHGRLGTPTMRERAEAAEAEVQRLTEGLRRIDNWPVDVMVGPATDLRRIKDYASALLAASPPDGGGAK